VDQAVYYKKAVDEHTVVTVSVDDMAITSKHLAHIDTIQVSTSRYFEISDLGQLSWLLGLKVERNRAERTITLLQNAYVDTVLERFHLQAAKNVQSP